MPVYGLEGRQPTMAHDGVYVAPSAVLIGSVALHPHSSVWFNAVIRADDENIVIGERANVQDNSVLHADPGFPLILGKNVTIGHSVMLHGCQIGEGCLIGIGSIVLNGAKIGKNSLIGAGALVAEGKEIPDGVLALGSPAKVVRPLTSEEIARLESIADIYVRRGQRYAKELTEWRDPRTSK